MHKKEEKKCLIVLWLSFTPVLHIHKFQRNNSKTVLDREGLASVECGTVFVLCTGPEIMPTMM